MASLSVRVLGAPAIAVAAAALLSAALVATGTPAALLGESAGSAALADERPNIILITTDDQATYDLAWMAHTQDLLVSHGVTFTQGNSPHPLCCPARAEILTGQYGQNNGVQHNAGPHGGYTALTQPNNHIGRWLRRAGYRTALVGKYLNGYAKVWDRPLGWDHWNPHARAMAYTSATYFNDGDPVVREGYVDDITNAYALDYIEEFSAGSNPFFMWVSNIAPHVAKLMPEWRQFAYPAPRFQGMLADQVLPVLTKPSFNERNVRDQPAFVPSTLLDPELMQQKFTYRIEALQAADEGVRDLVAALDAAGELDNTYIFFVSDNGYLMGEHRLQKKNYVFQEALLVPFVVRGPGIAGPVTSDVPVTLVDLAPTIAELAGVEPGRVQDGSSFAGVLTGTDPAWRDTQLIQTAQNKTAAGGWWVRGVRTARYTYGRDLTNGFEQLYDRARDPYETRNVASWGAYRPVLRELRRRFSALRDCAGPRCVRTFGPEPLPR